MKQYITIVNVLQRKSIKNNNKNIHFFAIAALAATLMVGQVQTSPVYAEDKSVQLGSLIPDNVTIEEPVPLSDISLTVPVCHLREFSLMMWYLNHMILQCYPGFPVGMENLMLFTAV